MKKRIGVIAGTSLLVLSGFALSGLPAQSGQSIESRLRALGMPRDAELGVIAIDDRGVFWDATYFDSSGKEHVLVHRERPKATPPPAP